MCVSQPVEAGKRCSLGILDVYGFESLARNGLERLLINYAAERVQAAVTGATLRREQDEYAREGLAWRALHYHDHELHADLLDAVRDPCPALPQPPPPPGLTDRAPPAGPGQRAGRAARLLGARRQRRQLPAASATPPPPAPARAAA